MVLQIRFIIDVGYYSQNKIIEAIRKLEICTAKIIRLRNSLSNKNTATDLYLSLSRTMEIQIKYFGIKSSLYLLS